MTRGRRIHRGKPAAISRPRAGPPGAVLAAMRSLALLVVLISGCSLYFPSSHEPPGDDYPPDGGEFPPPILDGGSPGLELARCEDGQLLAVPLQSSFDEPAPHGAGRRLGTCPGACQSSSVLCAFADCGEAARELCEEPASLGATCSLDGMACRGAGTTSCPESTACSTAVTGSTCTCNNGRYQCSQATPAAAVQAKLVGKWHGTMTTPFAAPYPISLWIYPDGTYWPSCDSPHCAAFYYGGDGPAPSRKLEVLSVSPTAGAWADIAIEFNQPGQSTAPPNRGEISALVVDSTSLRFTFSAAWLSCGQPMQARLTRDPE